MSVGCRIYQLLIDPLLFRLRKQIAQLAGPSSWILEVGSGTGAQSLLLGSRGNMVVAVDINGSMTVCAEKRARKRGLDQIRYKQADASHLDEFEDKSFQTAIVTLALHEMSHEMRRSVLSEMSRLADHLIVTDYAAPLPGTVAGTFVRLIERMAGREHFAGFSDYQSRGGLSDLFTKLGLSVEQSRRRVRGTIVIHELAARGDSPG